MGRYATRAILRYYCAQAGITLYSHRLDGVSYQYCAGGYVVNGYLGRSKSWSDLKYCMQQKLISLLKYGYDDNPTIYRNETCIEWHKEPHAISPLVEPICDHNGMKVRTLGTPEADKGLQEFYDFQKIINKK